MLAFPIINRTNHFVGVGEIELRLEALYLDAVRHLVPGTEVFVIDRKGTVVATTHPSLPTYTGEVVPSNYVLPANDRGRCTTAVFDDLPQRYRRCLLNATTYGHAGLAEAYAALPEVTSGVVKRRFGGADVIAGSRTVRVGDSLRWRVIVLVPYDAVLGDSVRAMVTALLVSVAVFVALAAVACVTARLLLSPLTALAEAMASGAYLREDVSTAEAPPRHSSPGGISLVKPSDQPKPVYALRHPSYLSDVAAIQRAYWTMADELRVLKGYIPEHVRPATGGQGGGRGVGGISR